MYLVWRVFIMADSSKDNGRKSRRGVNGKKALRKIVEELVDFGALTASENAPEYGYEGYDPTQFKAHEVVRYPDDSEAILYATSTLRSDRLWEFQWRALNIKKIDPSVERAFVILPDEDGFDQGTSPRDDIRAGRVVSAIDDIFTLQEYYDQTVVEFSSAMERGASNDLQGRKLEELIADILNDTANRCRFNGSDTDTGYMYNIFSKMMEAVGVQTSISQVRATTDIPSLPSGGNPKTDVAMKVELIDGTEVQATFSVKNTAKKLVSVHEYSADQFALVLDPHNDRLRDLLNLFQSVGNKRDMRPEDIASLTRELQPYLDKLNRWVFSGEGAPGVIPIQVAQYMVTRNKATGDFSVCSIDNYIARQVATVDGSGWFGSIFSWTYPSKKRGQKIQLKAHITE